MGPSKIHLAAEQLRRDLATISDEDVARMPDAERRLLERTRAAITTYFADAEASEPESKNG